MRTLGNGVSAHTASGGGGGCREKEQAGGRRQEASWVRREEDAADESAAGLARGGGPTGVEMHIGDVRDRPHSWKSARKGAVLVAKGRWNRKERQGCGDTRQRRGLTEVRCGGARPFERELRWKAGRPPCRGQRSAHHNHGGHTAFPLTSHCLSLIFHCLFLTSHCLSLIFHCLSLT